jgi:hypothetical protein
MPKKTKLICDKCGKEIKEGYQQRYMIVVNIGYAHQYNDGGSCPAVDRESQKFYLHFDCFRDVYKKCPYLGPDDLK